MLSRNASVLFVLLIVAMLVADASFTTPRHLLTALASPEIRYSIKLSLVSCALTTVLSLWVAVPIGYVTNGVAPFSGTPADTFVYRVTYGDADYTQQTPNYPVHRTGGDEWIRLEAARAVIEETAQRIDAGEGNLNTEGAVAKYMATEAGDSAADASIQALGGYGYTHEYIVEKISRDVRITRIYEGTSEIMEMTIGRDRWQLHLKTRGQYYHEEARKLEALQAEGALAREQWRQLLELCQRKVWASEHHHV